MEIGETIGKRIGRYEMRSKIGAGGMGEVYLAHDESLGRDVALKVLPHEFSNDADRLTRFRQEARAVSALNHPNILTIYEIGESEGIWFISTELVKGETLRDFIKREKSLSVLQSVKIAEQMAGALAAAHDAHIIHRDIKPENVMIRLDGYVKVLDFGLAKPLQIESAPEDATLRIAQTTPGLVMGSVRYMSPEQARGKETDERTDLWSLGICLFEMLAGKTPFEGETTSDTIAALIHQDAPPVTEYAPKAPPELQRIIRKALRKDKNERYQTAKDFALDLGALRDNLEHNIRSGETISKFGHASGENQTVPFPASENRTAAAAIHQTNHLSQPEFTVNNQTADTNVKTVRVLRAKQLWLPPVAVVAGLLILAVTSFAIYYWAAIAKPDKAITAFRQKQVTRLASDGKVRLPAISPDGKYVAFVSGEMGNRSLVVRQIATDSTITVVAPTALAFWAVDFAPDGNFIFYVLRDTGGSLGTLYRVPTLGGTPQKIIEDVDSRLTFAPDGKRFAFIRHVSTDGNDLLMIADADGTNQSEFSSAKQAGYDYFHALAWSPDNQKIAVGAGKSEGGAAVRNMQIAEISLKDKTITILNDQSWNGVDEFQWLRDGSGLLFLGSDAPNSPMQIWSLGYPNGVLRRLTNDTSQYTFFSAAADDATLVSVVSTVSSSIWTVGSGKTLSQLTEESRRTDGGSGIAEGADGKIFYTRNEEGEVNIYRSDANAQNATKLTQNSKYNLDQTVSPDGKYVVFISNRTGVWRVWRMNADGANPVQLTDGENVGDSRPSVTPDNSTIIFSRQIGNNGRAFIMKVPLAGGISETLSDNENSYDAFPRVSPDGKSVAYVAFDAAAPGAKKELLVREYDNGGLGKIKFSADYNLIDDLRWSPDSKSLTLLRSEGAPNLWQLSLETKKLTALTNFNAGRILNFAWSRDGKRILVVRGNVNNELVLIKNLTK